MKVGEQQITTKKMVIMGLMIALATILAQLPRFGSIGLDSMPAFFTAAFLGPILGGVVGLIAHLFIAGISAFPLTIPIHLVIAIMMFVSCYAYGYAREKSNRYIAMLVGIVLNGPVSLFIAAFLAFLLGYNFAGSVMFVALIIPLTLVATVNIVMADMVYSLVRHKI